MDRTIIIPTGLSIIENLKKEKLELPQDKDLPQKVKEIVRSREKKACCKLSAELSLLEALECTERDEVVFLATDTDDGERAAKVNKSFVEKIFGAETEVERIESLQLDNANRFSTEGLRKLVATLDSHVEGSRNRGRKPILSVGGGIKPVLPYVAVYGMLRSVEEAYVFERTRALIRIPLIPVELDWDRLDDTAVSVLLEIHDESGLPRESVQRRLGEHFRRLEGLFEAIDGDKVTLSAFGMMVLDSLLAARSVPLMLSQSAKKTLDGLSAGQRERMERLLDRIRIPDFREMKRHDFKGTDLHVFKPGSSAERIAYWEEGNTVYVAEIYVTHEEYERDLKNQRRDHYRKEQFVQHTPGNTAGRKA